MFIDKVQQRLTRSTDVRRGNLSAVRVSQHMNIYDTFLRCIVQYIRCWCEALGRHSYFAYTALSTAPITLNYSCTLPVDYFDGDPFKGID